MRRSFLFAVLVASLVFSGRALARQNEGAGQSSGSGSPPSQSPFEIAQDLAARGRLDQALTQLDQLATQNPEPKGVERLRGIIFYQQEKLAEAAAAFAKAMEEDPDDRESTEMRGVSLFRLGHPADALPFLEKAHAAVESANVDPQYVLGLCYVDLQRYDDARHAFATLYGFAPDSAEAHLLTGRLLLRREFVAPAADQVNKALQINPAIPLAHELLGEIALAKGDSKTAVTELESERRINPLDGLLYERLGDAYLRSGQYTDAQTALDRAVLLEPGATAPYILLGETFLKLKQPIPALQYLARAAKMDPSNYITHNLMGQAYRATGQVAEAKREFQLVVELQRRQEPKPAGK